MGELLFEVGHLLKLLARFRQLHLQLKHFALLGAQLRLCLCQLL